MPLVAAVDIGGTRTKLGVVAGGGRIVRRSTISTPPRGDPAPLVDGIAAALRPMLAALAARGASAAGVGVSVAGFLDREHTTMYGNANLPALCGFPLRRALEERLALPCRLEVDSNAATIAEYRLGAGRGAARLLGVTVGTGLGGGVVVDGALLRYTGQCAGDVGHIILDPVGRRCPCGARGCLEALVSSAALSERARGRSVRDVVRLAQRGESWAAEAIAETGRWLGLGLASLAPVFAPDRVVVGGGVSAAGDLLLGPTRESFRAHAAPDFGERVTIVPSSFGGWEGMVGAASAFVEPLA